MLVSEYTAIPPFPLVSLPFLLPVMCSEPWAAAISHWLKNGLFTWHFFWSAPIKITSFSTCTAPKHILLLPLSSTCHPLQGLTSACSYPSHYCQQLQDEYPLSFRGYCAPSRPNQTPNGIDAFSWNCLPPAKTFSKHLWTFSFSPENLLLPHKNTDWGMNWLSSGMVTNIPVPLQLSSHLYPPLIVNSLQKNWIRYKEITTMTAT